MLQLKFPKILITGSPGVGKTTLIKKILSGFDPSSAAGFYTAEIRDQGVRQGFELRGLNNTRQILAHVSISSPWRVGKYGVDVDGFNNFLDSLDLLNTDANVVVIDEIGKMESYSLRFQNIVRQILLSEKKVLGTIALKGAGFIHQVKQMPQVRVVEVTFANRNRIISEILVSHTKSMSLT